MQRVMNINNSKKYTARASFVLLSLALLFGTHANAQMSLTPAGIAQGFTLSTFATGFPNNGNTGPLGIAFNGSMVLVADYPGNVRVFPTDTDGQNASSAPVGQTYGFGNSIGLANSGGKLYMTRNVSGDVVQINPDGSFNQVIFTAGNATGLTVNPNNGHLLVSTKETNNIYNVDPVAKTEVVFVNASADGVATTSSRLYAVQSPQVGDDVLGYDITTHVKLFDSGSIANGPDGVATGAGNLAGDIFVNTNGGTLVEIDTTTKAQTVIASGGSRGDFEAVDPNGTLLLTQSDRVLRLTPGPGGWFGDTPEPGALALLAALSLPGGALVLRRRALRK
jgi:hypothetical protein